MKPTYHSLYLLALTMILTRAEIVQIAPGTLVNHLRFSVMAKYTYAKFYVEKIYSQWALELYAAHLQPWNQFQGDQDKHGLNDYQTTFHQTIDSLQKKGFDPEQTTIPVGRQMFLDGEHRIGTCLYLEIPVYAQQINHTLPPGNLGYSAQFFKRLGVSTKYLDYMATMYTFCTKNTCLILSTATLSQAHLSQLLNTPIQIVYSSTITLSKNGIQNLQQVLGNTHISHSPVSVQLIEYPAQTPPLVNTPLDGILMLDQIDLVRHMAQTVFNSNSIYMLNSLTTLQIKRLRTLATQAAAYTQAEQLTHDALCVDWGAITHMDKLPEHIVPYCLIHRTQTYHPHIDEYIYNPDYYFSLFGTKFIYPRSYS